MTFTQQRVYSEADGRKAWTNEEVRLLKQAYATWPVQYDLLPHRERKHIHSKAYRMGLTGRRAVEVQFDDRTPEEWAYFAGILDGEGTIHRTKHGNRVLSIASTTDELIEWLDARFPGGSIYTQRWTQEEQGKPFAHKKDVHHIKWTRMGLIADLINGSMPYLIIKKEKAMDMLANIESNKFSALT